MDAIQFNPDKKIWIDISHIVVDEGLSLYDLKRSGNTLSIFVEKVADGVSIGECSAIHKRLITHMMVNGNDYGIDPQKISFEVSSPGIYRALRLKSHFALAIGKEVEVVVRKQIEEGGKKISKVKGVLKAFDEDQGLLKVIHQGMEVQVELNNVKKANIA